MKKSVYYLLGLFLAMTVVFSACEDQSAVPDEGGAIIEFTLSGDPEEETARTKADVPQCDPDGVNSVYIVIDNIGYELTPQFFPQTGRWQLVLPINTPGQHTVSELVLLDADDQIIYAVPEVGSAFAGFVQKVLPFNFTIINGEKLVNYVEALCFKIPKAPKWGVKVLDINACVVGKTYFFSNLCLPTGHVEANIRGGLYFPELDRTIVGGFDDDAAFWGVWWKKCYDDYYNDYAYIVVCVSYEDTYKYYRIPVPVWLLKYYSHYGIPVHLLADCYPNICRGSEVAAIATEQGIQDFNPDNFDGTEISEEEFEEFMAKASAE